ncbi:fungal Zn, 2-cys(6) binuclear cluster domain protein [Rhizoctonia solani AG-3 Rhs1AP]|uniref:Fungal Zn, 2-cys(6) binuclear cluster domain protein n=1 Tax=Rhizoctonia solani AG-3 Rhs1AP TaxID=1086054 RepID=X8JF56_9AGAM|nr:fungal Zn, 2-cys(6) binuclear cluster domain protein [Rhizoctonia solani AG-3 Rhs1AP]
MAEPRVKKTTLACDSCRRRKRKCDGRMPVCSLCEKGNTECVYDATQDQRR